MASWAGYLEQFRAVLESILGGGFRRQLARQGIGESEDILQGMVVFVLGQPPEGRMFAAIATGERRLVQLPAQPFGNQSPIDLAERVSRLVFRRHFRFAQHAMHIPPSFGVGPGEHIRIQLIDPESALGLLGAMAGHTAFRQDRLH